MPLKLKFGLIMISILLFVIVILILRKDKIPVKYALVWFLSSIIIFLLGVAPDLFAFVSNFFGFETISNMVIGFFIFILLMICMSLTITVSGQKRKITLLMQEISILKNKINR